MKVKEILNEGTWEAPQTYEQAYKLAQRFRKPIPAGHATGYLSGLIGDDEIFDAIDEVEQKDGADVDVRPLIAYYLGKWISAIDFRKKPSDFDDPWNKNFGWQKPWDRKAVGLLKRLVKRWDV